MGIREQGGNVSGIARYRRWYGRLTLGTALTGYLLIVFGGIVRVTESGMGCATDWPHCNGRVVPIFSLSTAIEYTHRVLAGGIIILTLGLIALGWLTFRSQSERRLYVGLPLLAFVLVIVQALLGAITVFLELPPSIVMAHLGMAEIYFGSILVLVLLTFRDRVAPGTGRGVGARPGPLGRLPTLAALATLGLMMSGTYTAVSGAGYACTEWPLCEGRYLPTGWTVGDVQLTHRWLALLAVGVVLWLAWRVARVRRDALIVRWLGGGAVGLMLVQVVVGAGNIWFKLAPAVSAAHLAVATIIWGVLVGIVVVDRLIPARVTTVQAPASSWRSLIPASIRDAR
jgi:heme A synthase